MDWKKCEDVFIRKVELDNNRIHSIISKAKSRKKFIEQFEVTEDNVSFVIEGYYEIIKELLVAYLLKNGLRSKNHQCLITYFYRKNPNQEGEIKLIAQMSYYLNRLNYYGESIPTIFYHKHKDEILRIIKLIESLL